jgi:hypothetical protein
MRARNTVRATLLAFVVLLLGACTITFEPVVEVRTRPPHAAPSALIERFEPNRGIGATYYVGDPISFRIRTSVDGFVTLTAIDPDGSVYVFARNIPVRGGRNEVIAGLSRRLTFVVDPPAGRHFVRASFTPTRTSERVVYIGIVGYDNWLRQISIEIGPFPTYDQRETSFAVRR